MNATLRSSAQRTPLARATGMHAARTSMRTARPAPFITGKKAAAPAPQTSVKALDTEILMLSEGLETPVELFYVLSLVALLITAGFFVIRQVLIRRELDESAKVLGEKVRVGIATAEDYFELGAILVRKKLYTQAVKNLEKCKQVWDGEEVELAQVYNALGFAYLAMDRPDLAETNYREAVRLQPGYVTAWNNLGDSLERRGKFREALNAYEEALSYEATNEIAKARKEYCSNKLTRLRM